MSKQTKANQGMQRELPLFQAFQGGELSDAPAHLVAACQTHLDAVRLCIRLSRIERTYENWADLLCLSKGAFSLLLNGGSADRKRHFDPSLFERIQLEAGNRAISQWFDFMGKGLLNRQQVQRYLRDAI